MLAINPQSASRKTTPNILPCSIKYNGPIETEERYWAPTSTKNETSTAYFRGRKLLGKSVKVPDGYQGVVLEKTDKSLSAKPPTAEELRRMEEGDEDEMDMEIDKAVEVKTMERMYSFDEIVVWGHEMLPEDDDVYVKGVSEWVKFAEAVSSHIPLTLVSGKLVQCS